MTKKYTKSAMTKYMSYHTYLSFGVSYVFILFVL